GMLLTAAVLLAGGEAFLRFFPPRDFQPYLGDESGLEGPFRRDQRWGVGYRSWEAFQALYAERLAQLGPLPDDAGGRPTWAMFGTSFVRAPGMPGDTARAALPHKRIFHLARNEPLPVRFAQADLLLEQGLRPERLFIVLLPHDVWGLADHSLDQFGA